MKDRGCEKEENHDDGWKVWVWCVRGGLRVESVNEVLKMGKSTVSLRVKCECVCVCVCVVGMLWRVQRPFYFGGYDEGVNGAWGGHHGSSW